MLSYDPETGVFTWLKRKPKRMPGDVAGYVNSNGYVKIRVGGTKYSAHRLAWLHYYGVWPSQFIDHINWNRSDNRIANLRDVSHAVNAANHRPYVRTNGTVVVSGGMGTPGVRASKRGGRWEAFWQHQGKYHHFGTYDTAEEAAAIAFERRSALLAAA